MMASTIQKLQQGLRRDIRSVAAAEGIQVDIDSDDSTIIIVSVCGREVALDLCTSLDHSNGSLSPARLFADHTDYFMFDGRSDSWIVSAAEARKNARFFSNANGEYFVVNRASCNKISIKDMLESV